MEVQAYWVRVGAPTPRALSAQDTRSDTVCCCGMPWWVACVVSSCCWVKCTRVRVQHVQALSSPAHTNTHAQTRRRRRVPCARSGDARILRRGHGLELRNHAGKQRARINTAYGAAHHGRAPRVDCGIEANEPCAAPRTRSRCGRGAHRVRRTAAPSWRCVRRCPCAGTHPPRRRRAPACTHVIIGSARSTCTSCTRE